VIAANTARPLSRCADAAWWCGQWEACGMDRSSDLMKSEYGGNGLRSRTKAPSIPTLTCGGHPQLRAQTPQEGTADLAGSRKTKKFQTFSTAVPVRRGGGGDRRRQGGRPRFRE